MKITDGMTLREVKELMKQDMYDVEMYHNNTQLSINKVSDISLNCKGDTMKIFGTHTGDYLYTYDEMVKQVTMLLRKFKITDASEE